MASRVHGNGRHAATTHKATAKKPKLTAAQKAERKVQSYIHGHQRHGSHLAPGATTDAWHHIGQAKRQG